MAGIVVHAHNPSTQELRQNHHKFKANGLNSEFQASLGCIVRPCLKKPNQINQSVFLPVGC
jgi:hypothetical protein